MSYYILIFFQNMTLQEINDFLIQKPSWLKENESYCPPSLWDQINIEKDLELCTFDYTKKATNAQETTIWIKNKKNGKKIGNHYGTHKNCLSKSVSLW